MRFPLKDVRSLFRPALWLLFIIAFAFNTPTGVAQSGPYADNTPEVRRWIEERARRARNGRRELVRIPLVRRSNGWGCLCPEYYIGLSTGTTGGGTWLEPRFSRPAQRPSQNMIVFAEGYFTGKRLRRDLRTSAGEPEEWLYQVWEFRVLRINLVPPEHDIYDEDSPKNRVNVLR